LKIIVADDVAEQRQALAALLNDDGHLVCRAADGHGALTVLEQEAAFGVPVRLALLDVNLGPGIDGIEVARRMRTHAHHDIRACAVFFVSGEPSEVILERARSGERAAEAVRRYLPKPVDANVLRVAISELEGVHWGKP